ncbi:MAG: right-handed parallel beta-helix repeat-containing protein [Planctomycetota bacterium]
MSRPTKILLATLTLIGLCAALAVFLITHLAHTRPRRDPDAPPPPELDTARGEQARRTAMAFQRLLRGLDGYFDRGAAELRQFMSEHAETGWAAEGYLQLARRHARRGETDRALAELKALFALPDQGRRAARALLLKAELLESTDAAAARQALRQVRQDRRFPDLQMRAAYRLGVMALADGAYDEAIALLKEVAESGVPEKVEALEALEKAVLGRMRRHLEAGEWREAIAWADARIEEFGELATLRHALRYHQAAAYRHLGQFARARTVLERLRRDVLPELLPEGVDLDAGLAAVARAEEAAGIHRSPEAFLRAKQAGEETREHVRGTIDDDTTWEAGPLVLAGPVTVKQGATLTVAPGAEVQFLSGSRLIVAGALVAKGTADRPVRFTTAVGQAATVFDGEGVALVDSSDDQACTLEHCVFEYQRTGLTCEAAEPAIRRCTFTRNGEAGLRVTGFGTFALEGCTLVKNDGLGLHARGARAELAVRRCRVVNNGGDGISVESLGGKLEATLEANRVTGNGGRGITCEPDVAAVIVGNLIADNGRDGIYLNRFSGRRIERNILRGNQGAGIRCERDSAPEIVANAILRSQGNAIALSRGSGPIRENTIVGSASSAISLSENASPVIKDNWILATHGSGVQIDEGCVPTITGNAIVGFDPGPVGTLGRSRIQAQGNFFAHLANAREARRDPLKMLEDLQWKPIDDKQLDKLVFDRDNQPQLGEIVWRPRLSEPPPRPPFPELDDLP